MGPLCHYNKLKVGYATGQMLLVSSGTPQAGTVFSLLPQRTQLQGMIGPAALDAAVSQTTQRDILRSPSLAWGEKRRNFLGGKEEICYEHL